MNLSAYLSPSIQPEFSGYDSTYFIDILFIFILQAVSKLSHTTDLYTALSLLYIICSYKNGLMFQWNPKALFHWYQQSRFRVKLGLLETLLSIPNMDIIFMISLSYNL